MAKVIHLISDLHLSEEHPHLLGLFKHYMQHIAVQSEQLYVLGDLFELWVGDDHHTAFNQSVIDLFAQYTQNGGELFFGHGNRDFLLGEEFARACGGQLIGEPFNFSWQDKNICLLHGDSLCTDDITYQQLRTMVRNPHWQGEFLSQPVEHRLAFAQNLREKSKSSQQEKTEEIMDVNQQAVLNCVQQNQCEWLIHGHTHRPDIHKIQLENGQNTSRIVLSDWNSRGHFLELIDGQANSHYFEA